PDPSAVIDGTVLERLLVTVSPPPDAAALDQLRFRGHVPAKEAFVDGFEFRLRNSTGLSNPSLLTYARARLVVDNGANDTLQTAQPVPVPGEIAGRVEKRRDRDWFVLQVKKGATYQVEVQSN